MREKEIQILRWEVKHRTINLKVMFAMMGSPQMCKMFYNAQRKHYEEEKLKEVQDIHVHTLRQYNLDDEKKAEKNIENLYRNVHYQVNYTFQDRENYEHLLVSDDDNDRCKT